MKTKVYLCTVIPLDGSVWEIVFDTKVGDSEIITEFRKESNVQIASVFCREVNFYQMNSILEKGISNSHVMVSSSGEETP